jgi:phosphate transport system protein
MTQIRHAFHDELENLHAEVSRLGALSVKAVQKGTEAFLQADLAKVEEVIAADAHIDELMFSVEVRAYELVARQQPMAVDLRTLIAIMRVVHEIERVGDNMVNVVKAGRRLLPYSLTPTLHDLLSQMCVQAVKQLEVAYDVFARKDAEKAATLADMDDVMDQLQKDLFGAILREGGDDDTTQQAIQIALVGRYYERVADHAVNVADRVPFMVSGWTE